MSVSKRFKSVAVSVLLMGASVANAASIDMADWIFYVDGTVHEAYFGDTMPTTGTLVDGLGTLSMEVTGTGSHNVIAFFDFEIDQFTNGFTNEWGVAVGTPELGQIWEIDEPKYFRGDILDNVLAGILDSSNEVAENNIDDVGFALGWEFDLLADQTANIDFILSDLLPAEDFYLTQYDPASDASLFFSSVLNITGGTPTGQIPEPDPFVLALLGGLALLGARKTKKSK